MDKNRAIPGHAADIVAWTTTRILPLLVRQGPATSCHTIFLLQQLVIKTPWPETFVRLWSMSCGIKDDKPGNI